MRLLALLLILSAGCALMDDERDLFYETEQRETGDVFQIRPFYWEKKDQYGTSWNVLGPLIRYREDETFRRLQILPNIFYTERKQPQELKSWYFVFFPLLFVGNDDFLLLPFGGHSKGFLGFHDFLMVTPLYMRSQRVSSHPTDPVTYTTHAVLWPFLSWSSDGRPGGRRAFSLWPGYGEKDTADGGESGFVLWPFYTWRRHDLRQIRQWHLWPAYGETVTPTLREHTILWPIYTHREERKLDATGKAVWAKDVSVWPFWRRAYGSDDVEVHRYWPLYEYRRVKNTTTEYVLWPFFRRTYVDEKHQFAKYEWVVPFYTHVHRVSKETGFEQKKTTVWPLFRIEEKSSGERELAIPELLPIDAPSIRNWADPIRPFLSIYHSHKKPNGIHDRSVLFGLVMTRKTPKVKRVRILGGLVGWDTQPDGRYLRLLWGIRLRLGDTRK